MTTEDGGGRSRGGGGGGGGLMGSIWRGAKATAKGTRDLANWAGRVEIGDIPAASTIEAAQKAASKRRAATRAKVLHPGTAADDRLYARGGRNIITAPGAGLLLDWPYRKHAIRAYLENPKRERITHPDAIRDALAECFPQSIPSFRSQEREHLPKIMAQFYRTLNSAIDIDPRFPQQPDRSLEDESRWEQLIKECEFFRHPVKVSADQKEPYWIMAPTMPDGFEGMHAQVQEVFLGLSRSFQERQILKIEQRAEEKQIKTMTEAQLEAEFKKPISERDLHTADEWQEIYTRSWNNCMWSSMTPLVESEGGVPTALTLKVGSRGVRFGYACTPRKRGYYLIYGKGGGGKSTQSRSRSKHIGTSFFDNNLRPGEAESAAMEHSGAERTVVLHHGTSDHLPVPERLKPKNRLCVMYDQAVVHAAVSLLGRPEDYLKAGPHVHAGADIAARRDPHSGRKKALRNNTIIRRAHEMTGTQGQSTPNEIINFWNKVAGLPMAHAQMLAALQTYVAKNYGWPVYRYRRAGHTEDDYEPDDQEIVLRREVLKTTGDTRERVLVDHEKDGNLEVTRRLKPNRGYILHGPDGPLHEWVIHKDPDLDIHDVFHSIFAALAGAESAGAAQLREMISANATRYDEEGKEHTFKFDGSPASRAQLLRVMTAAVLEEAVKAIQGKRLPLTVDMGVTKLDMNLTIQIIRAQAMTASEALAADKDSKGHPPLQTSMIDLFRIWEPAYTRFREWGVDYIELVAEGEKTFQSFAPQPDDSIVYLGAAWNDMGKKEADETEMEIARQIPRNMKRDPHVLIGAKPITDANGRKIYINFPVLPTPASGDGRFWPEDPISREAGWPGEQLPRTTNTSHEPAVGPKFSGIKEEFQFGTTSASGNFPIQGRGSLLDLVGERVDDTIPQHTFHALDPTEDWELNIIVGRSAKVDANAPQRSWDDKVTDGVPNDYSRKVRVGRRSIRVNTKAAESTGRANAGRPLRDVVARELGLTQARAVLAPSSPTGHHQEMPGHFLHEWARKDERGKLGAAPGWFAPPKKFGVDPDFDVHLARSGEAIIVYPAPLPDLSLAAVFERPIDASRVMRRVAIDWRGGIHMLAKETMEKWRKRAVEAIRHNQDAPTAFDILFKKREEHGSTLDRVIRDAHDPEVRVRTQQLKKVEQRITPLRIETDRPAAQHPAIAQSRMTQPSIAGSMSPSASIEGTPDRPALAGASTHGSEVAMSPSQLQQELAEATRVQQRRVEEARRAATDEVAGLTPAPPPSSRFIGRRPNKRVFRERENPDDFKVPTRPQQRLRPDRVIGPGERGTADAGPRDEPSQGPARPEALPPAETESAVVDDASDQFGSLDF